MRQREDQSSVAQGRAGVREAAVSIGRPRSGRMREGGWGRWVAQSSSLESLMGMRSFLPAGGHGGGMRCTQMAGVMETAMTQQSWTAVGWLRAQWRAGEGAGIVGWTVRPTGSSRASSSPQPASLLFTGWWLHSGLLGRGLGALPLIQAPCPCCITHSEAVELLTCSCLPPLIP